MPELTLKKAIERIKSLSVDLTNKLYHNIELMTPHTLEALSLAISKLQLLGQLNEEKIRYIIQSHLYIEGNELMGFIEASQAIITYLTKNETDKAKKIAEILHCAGLDAYRDYTSMGRSADEWNKFRLILAEAILSKMKVEEI